MIQRYGKDTALLPAGLGSFQIYSFSASSSWRVWYSTASLIVADAVNNLSDSGSALIALFGFKLSSKPADAEHPYGHARMEYVSGLLISFVVFVLGLQLIKGSVEKYSRPKPSNWAGFSWWCLSSPLG